MKQQSVGIVLCALLLTTFGHDILNRHHAAQSARVAHSRARSPFVSRDNAGENCAWICEKPGDSQLNVTVNASLSLVGVSNSSARISLVIDVKANLILIFNHTSNSGIIINYESETVVSINGHIEISQIFEGRVSLTILFKHGEKISREKASVFIRASLIVLTAGEYTVSISESWNLVIHVARSVSVSLKLVIVVIRSGRFTANITLVRFIAIINGFANVVKGIEGGIEVIREHNVTISLEVLLKVKSSFEIAGYIWEQLSGADLKHIFHGLNTSADVIVLIAALAENSTDGVNGYVTFLSKLLLFIDGKESFDVVAEILIEFVANNKNNKHLAADFRAAVDSLYNLIVRLRLQERLKVVFKTLDSIRNGNLTVDGVNVSAIIEAINDGINGDSIHLIILIFKLLQVKLSIEVAVATLLLHLIELLTVPGGAAIIGIVFGIHITAEILNAGGNALLVILRGVSIRDLLNGRLGKVLNHLAVFGQVIAKINIGLKANGFDLTVEVVFKSQACGGIVQTIIKLVVAVVKHIHLPPGLPHGPGPVILSSTLSSHGGESESSESVSRSSSGDHIVGTIPSTLVTSKSDDSGSDNNDGSTIVVSLSSRSTTTESGDIGSGSHEHGHGDGHGNHGKGSHSKESGSGSKESGSGSKESGGSSGGSSSSSGSSSERHHSKGKGDHKGKYGKHGKLHHGQGKLHQVHGKHHQTKGKQHTHEKQQKV